jgi:adenine phosphoribosyltransferase
MALEDHIRSIPDFPKEGIIFRDITPLVRDASALTDAVDALAAPFVEDAVDVVVAPEARGFIFGVPVAMRLGAGFVPVRKPGKLPAETIVRSYELEYGTDSLAIHADAIKPGDRVLVLDDLLATGGTIKACCELVEELGGEVVGVAFLVELTSLNGRAKLGGRRIVSLIGFEGE